MPDAARGRFPVRCSDEYACPNCPRRSLSLTSAPAWDTHRRQPVRLDKTARTEAQEVQGVGQARSPNTASNSAMALCEWLINRSISGRSALASNTSSGGASTRARPSGS